MLTFKGKMFILLVCFSFVEWNLLIYRHLPLNIYLFLGNLTSWYRSDENGSVSDKYSSSYNDCVIVKQRKYKLVDAPQFFTDAEQEYTTLIDNNRSAILKILWHSQPSWYRYSEEDCNRNMKKCFQNNCRITYNRSLLKKSNAIIFEGPMPYFPRNVPLTPIERDPNQVWIFHDLESPAHFFNKHYRKKEFRSVFNWTMSYRLDSDIQHPYGVLWANSNPLKRDYRAIFRAKKRFAAWIVSHCNAVSKRDDFVRLLQKYIPVDIFGRCGKNNCSKRNTKCRDIVGKEYKFYLSFENSLCKDYITEKFFEYFPLDLIIVHRGHPTCNVLLPNDTYLNTNDFSSVQDLANSMKRLAEDEEQYISYLKSKDRYVVKGLSWSYHNALCDICYKLNNIEEYKMSHNDIVDWLENNTCVKAADVK